MIKDKIAAGGIAMRAHYVLLYPHAVARFCCDGSLHVRKFKIMPTVVQLMHRFEAILSVSTGLREWMRPWLAGTYREIPSADEEQWIHREFRDSARRVGFLLRTGISRQERRQDMDGIRGGERIDFLFHRAGSSSGRGN